MKYTESKQGLASLNVAIGFLLVAAWCLLPGCATSARTEFIDADGTSFKAVAKAGPFGQLDTTNQHLAYRWNATDGTIEVGNDAKGLDNSGQVQAVQASLAVLPELIKVLAPIMAAQQLPGLPGGGGGGDILDRYNSLCEIACRLAPEQAARICGCE